MTDWSGGSSPAVDCGVFKKYESTSCVHGMSLLSVPLLVFVLLIVTTETDVAYPVSELSVLGLRGEVRRHCCSLSVECGKKY